jgi:hypothetical protein
MNADSMRLGLMSKIGRLFLSLLLIQSQIALAAPATPSGPTPQNQSGVQVRVLKGVPGPDGKPVDAYVLEGVSRTSEGFLRVRGFDAQGNSVTGALINEAQKSIRWDGQTLEASPLKPSRVNARTTWKDAQKNSMESLIKRLQKGDPKLVQELHQENAARLEMNRNLHNAVGNSVQIGASFYMASAVLAVVELSTNYTDNPNAWSDFEESLNDPVGWLMLPTFIVASQGVYKLFNATKSWKMAVLGNGAGMAAGIIASTILGKIMMDPNFKKCWGFVTYDQRHRFERNENACDQLFANWSGEELFLTIVPVIGHAVLAGTMVSAFEWMASSIINAAKLGEKIKMTAGFLRKTPKGSGLVSIVTSAGSMMLFLGAFQLSYELVDMETSLREFFLKTFNPFSDPAGGDLNRNLSRMAHNFQGELDSRFSGNVSKDGTTLEATLKQHSVLMSRWRALKFKRVSQAFGQWQLRSAGLYENVVVSHEVYASMLDAISKSKRGEVDLNDRAFQDIVRSSIVKNPLLQNSHLDFEDLFDYVHSYDTHDFFIASMACGPDVDKQENPSTFWRRLKTDVFGDATPKRMIVNDHADKAVFYPPRLVPSDKINVCTQNPMRSLKTGWSVLDKTQAWIPDPNDFIGGSLYSPLRFFGTYEDQRFRGLYNYLALAVPEELAPKEGPSHFEEWWSQNVVPALEKVNADIQADYVRFLDTTYTQVLSHPVVECAYKEDLKPLSGAGTLLFQAGVIDECGERENFRLGEGLSTSVLEEVALYQAMTLKLLENQNVNSQNLKAKMIQHLGSLKKVFDGIARGRQGIALVLENNEQAAGLQKEIEGLLSQQTSALSPTAARLLGVLTDGWKAAISEGTVYAQPLLGDRIYADTSY